MGRVVEMTGKRGLSDIPMGGIEMDSPSDKHMGDFSL